MEKPRIELLKRTLHNYDTLFLRGLSCKKENIFDICGFIRLNLTEKEIEEFTLALEEKSKFSGDKLFFLSPEKPVNIEELCQLIDSVVVKDEDRK